MSKPGSGGVANVSEANIDRRERLRMLALETIDLAKDPYLLKNHIGQFECKLCLTLHINEASYLTHTQGKKHQTNLARRAAKDNRFTGPIAPSSSTANQQPIIRKTIVKIGRPGYKVTKIRDPFTRQLGLLFQIHYPQIDDGIRPRYRFMSAYEQRIETPDKNYQYILFAADPYETVAFKIPSKEMDKSEGKMWTHWDHDAKLFNFQLLFTNTAHEHSQQVIME